MLARPVLRLLRIPPRHFPTILEQLVFEERLFRRTNDNWCLFSEGFREPAVVMGLSGKPDKLLNLEKFASSLGGDGSGDGTTSQLPPLVVRRFSGGGTVVVDHNTLFVSWVCNKNALPHKIVNSPPALMQWTTNFYGAVLERCRRGGNDAPDPPGEFGLQEHDYCIGRRKFGGNAQCLTRDRWVHHTSFLWDFDPPNMEYLTLPEKRPAYREDRDHDEFLCRLRDHVTGGDRALFEGAVVDAAASLFDGVWTSLEEAHEILEGALDDSAAAHRISTKLVHL